jgi:hypothetical protein
MGLKILIWVFYLAYHALLAYLIYRSGSMILGNTFKKPWRGYSLEAIRYVAQHFSVGKHGKELKIEMESPAPELPPRSKIMDFLMPVAGAYFDNAHLIKINTRLIRNDRDLVNTLLHEICHHNQAVQGRLRYGQKGWYWFQPCEREARSFSSAWLGVALRMYRNKKNKLM